MTTLSTTSLHPFRRDRLITIDPHTLVMDAQELARKNGIHHLPVLSAGELVGVICTCDMLLSPADVAVRNIMKDPVALSIMAEVEEAARLMESLSVGSVLLTEESVPVGIVTRGDVFEKASVAADAMLSVCSCCGVRSHLRSAADGRVYCVYCQGTRVAAEERAS